MSGPVMVDVYSPRCMVCGNYTVLSLPEYAVTQWRQGMLVQRAFPEMLPQTREILLTGLHPDCWSRLFED